MKRPPAQENQCWHFVLDTELSGPECRHFAVDAPTQEKAETLVAEEFGIDVCIVSINGKPTNRCPKFDTKPLRDEVATTPVNAFDLFKPIKIKPLEENIVIAPYLMLPCATETKSWS